MKKIFTLLSLAALAIGLLGSCKKDDPDNPDPQGDKTFEETVKNLPGVYLAADYYDESGNGRVVNLKEDGTTEQYCFFDDNVEDGVDVDTNYTLKGTWTAFKVEDIPSKTGFICNLTVKGDPEADAVADTNYLIFNNGKTYILSTYFCYNEFFKVSQTFDEFKSKKKLEAFLPGHLKETELTKSGASSTKTYTKPPEYLRYWMEDLPDDVYLCDLSIPGSHDALSFRVADPAQTQTESLEKQFDWGIRFFDIRYCHENIFGRRVCPCHGTWNSSNRLRDISSDLELLESRVDPRNPFMPVQLLHTKECAIIWLKCDQHKDDKAKTEWCRDWSKNNVLDKKKDLYIPFRKDLKLGDVRGKIVVITRSDKWNEWAGYHEANPIMYIQDDCSPDATIVDLDKYDEEDNKEFLSLRPYWFKNRMDETRKSINYNGGAITRPFNDGWSIHHCSGYYLRYRPVEYSCDAYPKLLEVLQARPNDQTYGIVPMDFVGRNGWVAESLAFLADLKHSYSDCTVYTQPLIEQIVKSNDIFKK